MRGRLRGWTELLRSLGGAVLELLQAEAAALGRDLAAAGRHLRRGTVLLVLALGVAVATLWSFALLLFELLVLVLPRWGAAGVIFAVEAIVTAGLFWAGRRTLRRIESPRALVARRTQDHVEWWQRLLAGPQAGGSNDED